MKEPSTSEPLETDAVGLTIKLATFAVIEHVVPCATVAPVAWTSITSPDLPEFGVRVTVRLAASTLGGVTG